ncbi:MAG: hypothetical protein Q4G16_07825 [Cruoricaptor ignavus]|nr:hypothetical protein [Cruoricaptor ignavus]
MEKTIVFTGHNRNHIIYKGKKYDYRSYSGRIYWYFEATKLLSEENYYNEIVNVLEFNKYEINYIYNYRGKRLFIPVSKELIEYYITKDEFENNKEIILSNTHLNYNVDSFYEFDLQVELEGFKRIRFGRIGDFGTDICIPASNYSCDNLLYDEQLKEKMTSMFGKPKVHPQNEGDKYGRFSKEYFIPKARIAKIIGIKKYRDTSTIGQSDGEQFTGEVDEIILDLNNFDENIYRIFKEHGMLEIEGLE